GWLLDQTGPLTIRWPHLPALIPFLGRMILESHPSRYKQNAKALNQLTNLAVPEWNKLIKNTKSEDLIRPVGWLKVFESDASFNTYGNSVIESCKQFGVRCEALNEDELRQLEPHLSSAFKHGILQPDSSFVTNPQKLLNQLTERFIDAGGILTRKNIQRIEPHKDQCLLFAEDGDILTVSNLLISAGGWSNKLLKSFGQSVNLQVERGYHAMIRHSDKGPLLGRPTMFVDNMFVMAPMEEAMRLTCQVELAEVDSAPDYRRLRRLVAESKRLIPDLSMDVESEWMGPRPSQPDSVPTIAALPDYPYIKLAFGHQHLGVTMAAVTGRVVSDIFAGRNPDIDLAPYRVFR
ncbi:MAG: FAD-dependent oxidoreductase, partial [Alphaproteobacteria bacterium]|nr:FAD-dependent oxidoreductase [Alphaproteobacteria bacterium]